MACFDEQIREPIYVFRATNHQDTLCATKVPSNVFEHVPFSLTIPACSLLVGVCLAVGIVVRYLSTVTLCARHVNHVPVWNSKARSGRDTFVELFTDKIYRLALHNLAHSCREVTLLLARQFMDVFPDCFVQLSRPSPSPTYFNGLKRMVAAQNVDFCYVFLLGLRP